MAASTRKVKADGGRSPRRPTLEDLRAAPYNPRRISAEAAAGLGCSLESFGDVSGVVWNERTGNLVCGHQRVAQLVARGAKLARGALQLPNGERFAVRVVDWPLSREQAANVAANSPHIAGEFTDDLDAVLFDVKAAEPDLYDELLLGELETPRPVEVVEDEAPEVDESNVVTRPGDLWLCGRHRVLCGDSTKADDVAAVMGGEKGVLMNTDPPYGVAYSDAARVAADHAHAQPQRERRWGDDDIENDNLDGEKLQVFLESCIRAAVPHLTDNAAFYLWHPMLTQGTFFAAAAAAAADILIHRQIIWVKPSLLFGFGDYHWKHELCFYGWRRGHRPDFLGDRNQSTIWEMGHDSSNANRDHPTQKPVELFARPILNHTREGHVVYEPFAGSGSQYIAAEQLGRTCYGIEISPKYVDVICKRYLQATGDSPVRDSDGKKFADLTGA